MARECITKCPEILEAEKVALSGHSDGFFKDYDSRELMDACANSYDCSGPTFEFTVVMKGFFRKRTLITKQATCQLGSDQQQLQ
jgi:hypothetical protein